MSVHLETIVIAGEENLADAVPDWWELWHRMPDATPFQTPAWLCAWWRAFRPGELAVVAVAAGRRLVGIAPFYLETNARRDRLLPIGIALSDYIDVLVDPDFQAPALARIAATYAGIQFAWSEWELPHLATDARARAMPVPPSCRDDRYASDPCLVLPLAARDASSEALNNFADVPAAMRRKYRMAGHRVARHGSAKQLTSRDRDAAWWGREIARAITARAVARGEAKDEARLGRFFAEAIGDLALHGIARLHALMLGEQVAGVYFGFHANGRSAAYQGGYNAGFGYYSPGTVLIGAAIREALSEGAREFDFLRGREAYKYRWGAMERPSVGRRLIRSAP